MTLIHSTPLDFQAARVNGPKRLPLEKGLFSGSGTIESAEIRAELPFNNLVGSWNAAVPSGASIELHVQVRSGEGKWSRWYSLGAWDGGSGGRSFGAQEDAWGSVDVDTLALKRKADAFRYRITMKGRRASPKFSRVAFTYVDTTAPARPPREPFRPGPWVRELQVQPRSQLAEQERYRRDVCSPTSLAMVLEYWGTLKTTADIVALAQDKGSKLYGNWPVNVAAAATLGLTGQVERMPGFERAQELIAEGRPVIVSVGFGAGELSGSPIPQTKGHLMVISGFTASGDVIVNDPIAPAADSVRRVYKRSEFAKAWLVRKRGLAYVLGPRFPALMAAGVSDADVRKSPQDPKTPDPMDRERLTQIVYGERVRALDADGNWIRIEAVEQPSYLPLSKWHDYVGWVRADALTETAGFAKPQAVVKAKCVELPGEPPLSMGVRLPVLRKGSGRAVLRLLDGTAAALPVEQVRFLDKSEAPSRKKILAAAERFLGETYVWGGRSGAQENRSWGVDCSGLVNLSYRTEGVDLPRDAHEQFQKAAPVRRAQLKPGDLIFLTKDGDPERITHVMLYEGGDGIIESRQPKAVKTTFKEKFGAPGSSIESGDTVTDLSEKKPFKRRIFFGSVFI